MVADPVESSAAEEVRFTEDGVLWVGQTIGDGTKGRVLFGKDDSGRLHIQIVCDKRNVGGIVQINNVEMQDGAGQAKWLHDWFCPRPLPGVTCLGLQ